MSRKQKLPRVALVGRTNVGKSTLFNRLSEDVKSITFESEGITRDFLKDTVCWQGVCFELLDTGGITYKKSEDPFVEQIREKALQVIEQSDVLVMVVDGAVGLVPEDTEIARKLHRFGVPTILVVNKSDTRAAREHEGEFVRLGFSQVIAVSALHGRGIADLLESIIDSLPKKIEEKEEEIPKSRVIILGKPNVGKSSLLNLLLKEERAIVADMPGTTREALTERIRFYDEDILMTDTPGLRKKRKVTEPIEQLMAKSALRTIEQADIVLLVIDASAGVISDQELKLAFYVFQDRYKALIILYNKSDLMDEITKKDLEFSLSEYTFFLKYIPELYISCATEKNVGKILPLIQEVSERYQQQFSSDELTLLFKQALERHPLYRQEKMLIVRKAKQIKTGPPTIKLFVNLPKFFGPSQLKYLENVLRDQYDLEGIPVRFVV